MQQGHRGCRSVLLVPARAIRSGTDVHQAVLVWTASVDWWPAGRRIARARRPPSSLELARGRTVRRARPSTGPPGPVGTVRRWAHGRCDLRAHRRPAFVGGHDERQRRCAEVLPTTGVPPVFDPPSCGRP